MADSIELSGTEDVVEFNTDSDDEQISVLHEFTDETTELINDLDKFKQYLFHYIRYLNTALPGFYTPQVKTMKARIDLFENLDQFTFNEISDIAETEIYKYISEFVNTLLPISIYVKARDPTVFDFKVYNSIDDDNVRSDSKFLVGSKLNFCNLWEDTEVTDEMKMKIITFNAVLYSKGEDIKDGLDKLGKEVAKRESHLMMSMGIDAAKGFIPEMIGEDEGADMLSVLEIVGEEIIGKNINPMELMMSAMMGGGGGSGDAMNMFNSVDSKMKSSGIETGKLMNSLGKISNNLMQMHKKNMSEINDSELENMTDEEKARLNMVNMFMDQMENQFNDNTDEATDEVTDEATDEATDNTLPVVSDEMMSALAEMTGVNTNDLKSRLNSLASEINAEDNNGPQGN